MNLKKYRTKAKLNQSELARICGVNQTAVSQWERGETLPKTILLPILAKALNCSVDELLSEK